MQTLGQIMSKQPQTIGSHRPLSDARQTMETMGVRHLPVLKGGHLVGMLSERDVAMVESLPGVDLEKIAVDEAMSPDVWSTSPATSMAAGARAMAERRIGTTVIVEGDEVVGIVSAVDLLFGLADLAEG